MAKYSIIVAAYNIAPYIGRCLESLTSQTFSDIEIIVVDDCSTDSTADIICEKAEDDSRIKIVRTIANSGLHVVRKRGVERAEGERILFVDGDDELKPDAIEKLDAFVKEQPEQSRENSIVLYGCDVVAENGTDENAARDLSEQYNHEFKVLKIEELIESVFAESSESYGSWSMVLASAPKKSMKRAFERMANVRMERMEDAYEFLVLADNCESAVFMPEKLAVYHWGRGITGTRRQSAKQFAKNVHSMRIIAEYAEKYAQNSEQESVKKAAQRFKSDVPKHISTELVLRTDPEAEQGCALEFAREWGTSTAVSEMNRLISDRAETILKSKRSAGSDDELWKLIRIRDFIAMSDYSGFGSSENLSGESVFENSAKYEQYSRQAEEKTALVRKMSAESSAGITQSSAGKTISPDSTNRLAIFCFYDKNGHAAGFIKTFLDDLQKNISRLVVVVNGKLDDESRALFEKYTKHIILRDNRGLDAAAYKQVILSVGWEQLETFDEVICLNDTCLGPVYPFKEMFSQMASRPVDFWGITAYSGETVNEEVIPTHLQAYWHVYRRSLVCSPEFKEYWQNMPIYDGYAEVTRKHEIPFTKHFEELGFEWDSYVDHKQFEDYSSYPLLYMPMQVIRDARCPVFKRRVFFVPYEFTFDQTAGQPAMDLYDYIRDHTSYDVDLIWDALLQSYNVEDIRKAMHLDYILPSRVENPRKNQANISSAFIYHIFFTDLLDDTLRYIEQIPDETDLYITTTEDKISLIREKMRLRGINKEPVFITVVNRGRDVSALLVASKDVVLSGKYDVIGFAHDKKSGQNQQNGHHGSESQGFAYKLMENTLGSTEYVRNILTLFADNPRLGQVSPPPPFHALYFGHTRPSDWAINFEPTRELLEEKLGIHVPLDESKGTMSAIGSCYWFRVDALRPLFEYGWEYTDFLPEGLMGADGSISHAIERANGYIAQSRGYYPAWVMSDRYARIETDSLYHTTDILLKGMGIHRQGETLLQTAGAMSMQLDRKGRYKRAARRKLHNSFKWVGKNVIQKMPDPVENAMYRIGWAPINAVRNTKAAINKKRYERTLRIQTEAKKQQREKAEAADKTLEQAKLLEKKNARAIALAAGRQDGSDKNSSDKK